MKQPIIAAIRTLTSAYILSMLLWYGSSASEHTTTDDQPEALVYNPEATAKLQEVFNATNDRNYTENSPVLGRLVKDEHADPNIKQYGSSDSLLRDATLRDNAPLVEVLLTHRANPNPLDIYNPIFTAKSAAVVKLLVDAKADIHALSRIRQNVLHEAAMYGAPADVITFWCNAGVNLHLKDFCETTPLQTLLTSNYPTGARIAPFLWTETNFTTKDEEGAVEKLTKHSPQMIPTLKALITIVPEVKAEKTARYEQTKALLTRNLNLEVMPLVMGYTRQLPGHLYDVRYFKQDIEPRMIAMLAAENGYKTIIFLPEAMLFR